jgi:hypothetical protein
MILRPARSAGLFLCGLGPAGLFPDGGLGAFNKTEETENGAVVHKGKIIGELDEFEAAQGGLDRGKRGGAIESALADEDHDNSRVNGREPAGAAEDEDAVADECEN